MTRFPLIQLSTTTCPLGRWRSGVPLERLVLKRMKLLNPPQRTIIGYQTHVSPRAPRRSLRRRRRTTPRPLTVSSAAAPRNRAAPRDARETAGPARSGSLAAPLSTRPREFPRVLRCSRKRAPAAGCDDALAWVSTPSAGRAPGARSACARLVAFRHRRALPVRRPASLVPNRASGGLSVCPRGSVPRRTDHRQSSGRPAAPHRRSRALVLRG